MPLSVYHSASPSGRTSQARRELGILPFSGASTDAALQYASPRPSRTVPLHLHLLPLTFLVVSLGGFGNVSKVATVALQASTVLNISIELPFKRRRYQESVRQTGDLLRIQPERKLHCRLQWGGGGLVECARAVVRLLASPVNCSEDPHMSTAGTLVGERPFHLSEGGGGCKIFFSRLFFQLMLKLVFFHTPVEARFFFHKEWKVRFLVCNSYMLGRQLFLPLCRSDRLLFFITYQNKTFFFQHTG